MKPSASLVSTIAFPPVDFHRYRGLAFGRSGRGVPLDRQPGAEGERVHLEAAAVGRAEQVIGFGPLATRSNCSNPEGVPDGGFRENFDGGTICRFQAGLERP